MAMQPPSPSAPVRTLFAIFPTWRQAAKSFGQELLVFFRDVTKAYLQSKPTQHLIYYSPPKEFFEAFPEHRDTIWKANAQLYGDVEAGLYWSTIVFPWYFENILYYQQSMYDPSLLHRATENAATVLCSGDSGNIINTKHLHQVEKTTTRFKCRERQYPPWEFKGVDVLLKSYIFILSQ